MSTYRLTAINNDSHQSIKTIVPLAFWPNKQMHIFSFIAEIKWLKTVRRVKIMVFYHRNGNQQVNTHKHHCLGHLMTSDDEVNRKVE